MSSIMNLIELRELFTLLLAGILYIIAQHVTTAWLHRSRSSIDTSNYPDSFYFTSGSLPPILTPFKRRRRIEKFLQSMSPEDLIPGKEETISDYICIKKEMRDRMLAIQDNIVEYCINPKKKRPLNLFLYAPPGSGKSFYIENLVKYINSEKLKLTDYKLTWSKSHEINLTDCRSYNDFYKRLKQALEHSDNNENVIPVIFVDEVDAQLFEWQPFKSLLVPMWDGRISSIRDAKYSFGKCILVFAASLSVKDPSSIADLVKNRVAKYYSRYSRVLSKWRKKFYQELPFGVHLFKNQEGWVDLRMKVLLSFQSQKGIEKAKDFFDRVDYYLSIPSARDYFKYLDNESLYFADKETILMIVSFVRKYYTVTNIDTKAISALTSFLFSSVRDLERKIFLAKCPPKSESFLFEHLDKELRDRYSEISNNVFLRHSGRLVSIPR